MKTLFCSLCGKEDVPLHDSFCFECYWKNNHCARLKKDKVEINICTTCGSVLLPGGWTGGNTPESLPPLLADFARKWIITSIDNDVEAFPLNEPDWEDGKPRLSLLIRVTDNSIPEFQPFVESLTLDLDFLWGTCSVCAKKEQGGRTIFQLRAIDRFLTSEETEFVEEIFRKLIAEAGEENPLYFVSKKTATHKGWDYHCGSNSLVEHVIDHLKRKWTAITNVSYSLVGETKDGTRIYQHTYLFKLPAVKPGDLIYHDDSIHQVVQITPTGIQVKSLKDSSSRHIKDWSDIYPLEFYEEVSYIVLSRDYVNNTYELMDLKTYESKEVLADSLREELEVGEEQKFILYHEELYLPPSKH